MTSTDFLVLPALWVLSRRIRHSILGTRLFILMPKHKEGMCGERNFQADSKEKGPQLYGFCVVSMDLVLMLLNVEMESQLHSCSPSSWVFVEQCFIKLSLHLRV
jgi:hypothetical protein